MLRFERPVIILTLCTCFSGYVFGQAWSGVLNPSRAVDWSQAGAPKIKEARTQCATAQCSSVSAGTVTSASINAAIASAPPSTYVLIPAGNFTISSGISVNNHSNVTLRGAGANSTFLNVTGGDSGCGGGSHAICVQSSDINYMGGPSNTATWSAGYVKGSTSITLSSVTNLSAGDPIVLDQLDDAADTGGLWVGCEVQNSRCGNDGPSGYQRTTGGVRGQQQMVTVTSISGTGPYTVGISPGLYAPNWTGTKSPGAWWATNPVFNVGFENFSITQGAGDGILLFNCSGCWVKGVRSVRTTSTGTAWFHVSLYLCNHCTVRDSYFYGLEGDSYVIPVSIGSDALIENNIIQRPGGLVFNSDCEGCVVGYNFSVNSGSNSTWFSPSQWFHSVNMFTLNEGNIGGGLYADGYHGSHVLNTAFRNRWDGREQSSGMLTTGNTAAYQLAPGARYHNIIGNVLGTPGYHTRYVATPSSDTNWTAVISAGLFEGTGGTDTLSFPTSMWWGNWDNVTNVDRWNVSEVPSSGLPNGNAYANQVPTTQTLPASFYRSSRPSFWPSDKPWPNIGPDVTNGTVGQCAGGTMQSSSCSANSQCPGSSCGVVASGRVVSSPAMDCYFTVMGGAANGTGGALEFDAAACYPTVTAGGGGGGTVNPPAGLSAIVQ